MRQPWVAILVAAVCSIGVGACTVSSGGQREPTQPQPPPPPPPPAPAAAQPDPAPAEAEAEVDPAPADTTATPTTDTAPASEAKGGSKKLKKRLKKFSKGKLDKDMKPAGAAFTGELAEGGTAQHSVAVEAGKCYTALAVSGVQELDLEISFNQPPVPPPVIAKDDSTGPDAALGAGDGCIKNPSPMAGQVQLTLRAAQGSGPVLLQVYAK